MPTTEENASPSALIDARIEELGRLGIFNASLEGNARRAIDLHEGDHLDDAAFQDLVRAAADLKAS